MEGKRIENLLQKRIREINVEHLDREAALSMEEIVRQIMERDLCLIFLSAFDNEEHNKLKNFTQPPMDFAELSPFCRAGIILLVDKKKDRKNQRDMGVMVIALNESGYEERLEQKIKIKTEERWKNQKENENAEKFFLRVLWVMEAYAKSGSYDAAYSLFKEAHEKVRKNNMRHYIALQEKLACLYWAEIENGTKDTDHQYDKIAKIYREIVEQVQNQDEAVLNVCRYHRNLAYINKLQRKYTQAKSNYNKAIKYAQYAKNLDRKRLVTFLQYNLAEVCLKLGEYKEAEELYQKIREQHNLIDLTETDIWSRISLVRLEQEKYSSAKDGLEAMCNKKRDKQKTGVSENISYMQELGDAYYGLDEFSKAEEQYKKIIKMKEGTKKDLKSLLLVMYSLLLVYSKERGSMKNMEELFNQIQDELERERKEERRRYKIQEVKRLNKIEDEVHEGRYSMRIINELQRMIQPYRTESEMYKIRELLKKLLADIDEGSDEEKYSTAENRLSRVIHKYLAQSYKIQGRFDEAENVYQEGIGDVEKTTDIIYRRDLAEIFRAQGRLLDAERIFGNVLESKTSTSDGESHRSIEEQTELIRQYLLNKKYKEVSEQCGRILEMVKSEEIVLPEEDIPHFGVARFSVDSFDVNPLSVDHFELLLYESKLHQRKYREVEEWCERKSIASREYHSQRLLQNMLLRTYRALQEYDKARALLDNELERARGGVRSFELEEQLVRLYMDKEEWDIAEKKCIEILGYWDILEYGERRLSIENVRINKILYVLVEIYNAQGRVRDAERLCKRALGVSKRILGKLHPDTIVQHRNLFTVYINQEKFEKAEELLGSILKDAKELWGENHAETLKFKYDLARVYVAKKSDKAEDLLKDVVHLSKSVLGDDSPETLRFINGLANFYVKEGNIYAANQLFSDVLKQKNILDRRHPEIREAERGRERLDNLPVENESKHSLKQETLVRSITNQLLLYYENARDNMYLIRMLLKALNEQNQYENEKHEKRLKLAEIYHKEERYLKVIQLYYKDILNKDREAFEENKAVLMILTLLSSSYLKLKSQRKHLKGVDVWMEMIVRDAELRFGCTNFREVKKIRENVNRSYILQKNNIKYALRQNNESIKGQFIVENFLDIKRFDATITPLTCLFGDNHAGKTVIMKMLYACQSWAYRKVEDTTEGVKYSKDSFLQSEYRKEREENNSEKESFDTKLREIVKNRRSSDHKKREIDILKEGKEFFDSRLRNMIKYQMQSITSYIDRKGDVKQVWEDIIMNRGKDPMKISGKNHFFDSDVFYNRSKRDLEIRLRWEKIKRLTLRIIKNTVQLQVDIQDEEEEITLCYYMFRREGVISIAPDLPIYVHSPTTFFVDKLNATNIKICVLNILFYCTPFVFFEGTVSLFPAHRTGSSVFLPSISTTVLGGSSAGKIPDHISQEDIEVMVDILVMGNLLSGDWRIRDQSYHERQFLKRGEKRNRYQRVLRERPYVESSDVDERDAKRSRRPRVLRDTQKIRYFRKQSNKRESDVQRLGANLYSLFGGIEKQKVEVVQRGGAAIEMLFHKRTDNEDQERQTARQVATSTLSLALLNLYIGKLKDRFTDIEKIPDRNILSKTQEEQVTEIMKYQELSQAIFYDEPENSLHPHRVIEVIKFLFEVYRGLRDQGIPWSLFCITHSPRVLRLLLYGVIETFEGDVKKIKDHYSPIEFILDEEDGLYVGTQLEIDEDVEYEKYPFSEVNREEYMIREEMETIVEAEERKRQ